MIEWKKYEVMRGMQFPRNKEFLILTGTEVNIASHYHERLDGYQWWLRDGTLKLGVTHYAEINLPQGE